MTIQRTVADRYATVNGLRLHYLDWGNARARPMILLHGLRGFCHDWDDVAEQFCDRYRILALDQRGRGDSDWAPDADYFTGAYVSDLEQFIEQLNLNTLILMGHSMGGINAIVYASRYPGKVAALVIEDVGPMTTPPAGVSRVTRELQDTPTEFGSWAEAWAFCRTQRPEISDEAGSRRVQYTLRQLPDGRVTWKYDLGGILKARLNDDPSRRVDLWPHVRNLQCQTLVIRGGLSDVLSRQTAEEMARANASIRLVEVPEATHYVHDDVAAFNAAVADFLDRIA